MRCTVDFSGIGDTCCWSEAATAGSNDVEDGSCVSLRMPVPKPDVMLANARVGIRNQADINQRNRYSLWVFFRLLDNALLLGFSLESPCFRFLGMRPELVIIWVSVSE